MKRKELDALHEYRMAFYNVKFQLGDIVINNCMKEKQEEMLTELQELWEDMSKLCEKLH